MEKLLIVIFMWVCNQMEVDYKTQPLPEFRTVNPTEMAIATCGSPDPKCPIMPALYDGRTFYVIEDLDFIKNRRYSSFIVHHMVHVVQFNSVNKDGEKMKENFEKFEAQALELQTRWLGIVETSN